MREAKSIDAASRAIREHVELAWEDAHVDGLLRKTKARGRRRTVVRIAAAAAVVALACTAALAWPAAHAPVAHAPSSAESDRVIHLADGSTVIPLTRDSQIVVVHVSDDDILLDVVRGGARFEVVRGLPRSFRVTAGQVQVAVVGTVFEVRREGEGANVRVIEGHVRVTWPPDGEAMLSRGDSGQFPQRIARAEDPSAENARRGAPARARGASPDSSRAVVASAGDPSAGDPSASDPSAGAANAGAANASGASQSAANGAANELAANGSAANEQATNDAERAGRSASETNATTHAARAREQASAPAPWRELADRGEYEEAAHLLESDASALDDADLDELLLASDTLRLGGQPERALTYLDRAARLAEGDARAPLIAFTRGRLLLGPLARFDEAARAFAAARALAPDGSLATDALAREVEALARAGDAETARARAEEYVERYPNGLHIAAVRRWGELATP